MCGGGVGCIVYGGCSLESIAGGGEKKLRGLLFGGLNEMIWTRYDRKSITLSYEDETHEPY